MQCESNGERTGSSDAAEPSRVAELCQLGLAVSSARRGLVEESVDRLMPLAESSDFREYLSDVFPEPSNPTDPAVLGRALTLFRAGNHAELRTWLEERHWNLRPLLATDPVARRTWILHGENLIALWRADADPAASPPGGPTGRRTEPLLTSARETFEACLSVEEDVRARIGLATTFELEGRLDEALTMYEKSSDSHANSTPFFRELHRIHATEDVAPTDRQRAWRLLQRYEGDDEALSKYVGELRQAIGQLTRTYCTGCGRKATNPDALRCVECGRKRPTARSADDPK